MITTCGTSFLITALRMRATAYGSSARESSMRMARSTPIASAARTCSSTAATPMVTPTISIASPRSRIRNASSMAISSNGLITDLGVEIAAPATVTSFGSGTLLNETMIFIYAPVLTRRNDVSGTSTFTLPLHSAAASHPQHRSDDVALDLARPRVELAADRVAQLSLNFVLGHVAVTAVDLDRVLTGFHPRIGDVQLGHRRLEIHVLTVAAQPGEMVKHVPGTLDAHFHVHDL